MSTLLCVPIMVRDAFAALRDAAAAKDAGADLVEFRLDEAFQGEGDDAGERAILKLIADSPLPCIATCRPTSEGGHYDGDEPARISLLQRLATATGKGEHPPRYIDVELEAYTRSDNIREKIGRALDVGSAAPAAERPTASGSSLILSFHDFQGRPADLTRRVLRMQQERTPSVLKISYRARSLRDNLELFDLLAQRDRPTTALGMGEFGLISRILAPKFGGFLTFASLRPEEVTAPGQPTISDLLNLYRFRSIKPSTAVYGIVGYPIDHSLSPHVHNAGFEAIGADAVYLPLPIPGGASGGYENLKATLGELIDHPSLNLRGLSITSPHKESLARLAAEQGWKVDATTKAIGAANTLTIHRDSSGQPTRIEAANTDAPALASVVQETLGGPLTDRRTGVVGAGGVARAAVHGLAAAGAHILIFNRTPERAAVLAASASALGRVETADLADIGIARCDAIIHCTPVGMTGGPAPGDSALSIETLPSPGAAIIETVYSPLETPLLKAARARGLRTVEGLSMFLRQAALQFETWTGTAAPLQLFERVSRETLAAREARA